MALPGTKVIVHTHPDKRASWELQGEQGWYIGPSLDHYRCMKCYIPRTRAVINSNSIEFFPRQIPFPEVTLQDHLKQAVEDIIAILMNLPVSIKPSLQEGDPTNEAILSIAKLLNRADKIPNLSKLPTMSVPRVKSKEIENIPTTTNPLDKSNSLLKQTTEQPINIIPYEQSEIEDVLSPRVTVSKDAEVPVSTLLTRSLLPKNVHFQNTTNYQYGLRSRTHLMQHIYQNWDETSIAEYTFNPIFSINHIYNEEGKKETIDSLLSGHHKDIWNKSLSNEWGRLAQGNDAGVNGTNTIVFIPRAEVPDDKKVTYASMVCDYRLLKDEKHRIRIIVGEDRLVYYDDAASPATNILETKIMINSTISNARRGARFITLDIKDYFLATPIRDPEYMRVRLKYIPEDIRKKYHIMDIVTKDNWVFIKIQKGMPGLKQAAILAYQHLKNSLEPYGYTPIEGTVGLWKHDKRPTKFCLCVDDFGVKYWSKSDADHLCNAITANFRYTVDKEGTNYCGLTLSWNYPMGYVDISIPKYIHKALHKLNHQQTTYPQYSPYKHSPIIYGKKGEQQMAESTIYKELPKDKIRHIQSIAGTFLYYARALDFTMLTVLNDIATTQAKPTTKTLQECQQLMDYTATYPYLILRFYESEM